MTLSLSIFTAYVLYIALRYGVLRSISASYHKLTLAEKWLFTLSTWGYVIPLVLAGLGQSTYQDILLFFAGFLLSTVGVMADDKSETQKKWHTIGAEGGILLAFIWILTTPFWFVAVPSLVGIFLMIKLKLKNHTWWVETLAYFTILFSIYLNSKV